MEKVKNQDTISNLVFNFCKFSVFDSTNSSIVVAKKIKISKYDAFLQLKTCTNPDLFTDD